MSSFGFESIRLHHSGGLVKEKDICQQNLSKKINKMYLFLNNDDDDYDDRIWVL